MDGNATEISGHRLALGAPPRRAGQQERLLADKTINGAFLRLGVDAYTCPGPDPGVATSRSQTPTSALAVSASSMNPSGFSRLSSGQTKLSLR